MKLRTLTSYEELKADASVELCADGKRPVRFEVLITVPTILSIASKLFQVDFLVSDNKVIDFDADGDVAITSSEAIYFVTSERCISFTANEGKEKFVKITPLPVRNKEMEKILEMANANARKMLAEQEREMNRLVDHNEALEAELDEMEELPDEDEVDPEPESDEDDAGEEPISDGSGDAPVKPKAKVVPPKPKAGGV